MYVLYICTLLRSRAGTHDDDTPHAATTLPDKSFQKDRAASTHHPGYDILPDAGCMVSCGCLVRAWGMTFKWMRLGRSARTR